MKSAILDIETSDLAAVGQGFCLCAVVKPLDKTPIIFRFDKDGTAGHEENMLLSLLKTLEEFDVWIGHNIERFDFMYLKTRAMVLSIPFSYSPFLYDTLKAYRRVGFLSRPNGMGKPSAGLGIVGDTLGVTTNITAKTAIYPREQWKAVWQTDPKALGFIIDHCVRDVKLNEQVFKKLWPLDTRVRLMRAV